jgi:geranylgeranyl reductase family protein
MTMECDVLILGAGPAGSCAARFLAEKNLNIILVEQHKREDVGKKVCGEGLTSIGLKRAGLYPPSKELGTQYLSSGKLISPNKQTNIPLIFGQKDGYAIDRNVLGQMLIQKAEQAGVKILFESTAQELLWNNGKIAGAVINGKPINAKSVIVATGMSGFRFKTPAGKSLTDEDIYVCYRERILVDKPDSVNPEHIYVYLNQKISPGGYIWYFPLGTKNNKLFVNFGLGIQGSKPEAKNTNLKDMLVSFRKENPELFKNYELFNASDSFNASGGIVPIRHVLESLTDIKDSEPTGLVYAGDVGSTVDPIHGGGMRYSMDSAFYLTEPVAEFIKTKDYSKLWQYNIDYIKNLGGSKQGVEYIFSKALQTASDEEINLLMKHVLDNTDIEALVEGQGYNFEKAKILGKLAKLALSGREGRKALIRLFWAYIFSRKIKKQYSEYPDTPANLDAWSAALRKLLSDYKEKLSKI